MSASPAFSPTGALGDDNFLFSLLPPGQYYTGMTMSLNGDRKEVLCTDYARVGKYYARDYARDYARGTAEVTK